MNKRLISVLILVSMVVAGGFYGISAIMGNMNESGSGRETNREEANLDYQENEAGKEEKNMAVGTKKVVEIAAGKEVPNFTLRNLEGEAVSLEDYRGKIVLLNFWATWCVYCDIEMPDLQKLDKENEDLVVLAVDVMESRETVEKYIKDGGYDFEVVLDEDGAIARLYLVGGYPTSYFIDGEGILRLSVPGMMTYEQMNKVLNDIRQN